MLSFHVFLSRYDDAVCRMLSARAVPSLQAEAQRLCERLEHVRLAPGIRKHHAQAKLTFKLHIRHVKTTEDTVLAQLTALQSVRFENEQSERAAELHLPDCSLTHSILSALPAWGGLLGMACCQWPQDEAGVPVSLAHLIPRTYKWLELGYMNNSVREHVFAEINQRRAGQGLAALSPHQYRSRIVALA